MKRYLLPLLVCLLVFRDVEAKLYTVSQDILVKNGKKSHSAILGVIKKGTTIDIEEVNKNTWGKVTYKGNTGYVKTRYLKAAPQPEPAPVAEKPRVWTLKDVILLITGIVLFIFLIRKLVIIIRDRASGNANSKKHVAGHVHKPTHWYQCRQCRLVIRHHTTPSDNGCVGGVTHRWTEMAEVGINRFFCRHCTTTIKTKTVPADHGCPGGDKHNWTQLS